MVLRTAFLDALDSSVGDGTVNRLGSVLDGLGSTFPHERGGAEKAGLTSNLGAEHGA